MAKIFGGEGRGARGDSAAPMVNENIKAKVVRLIGADGEVVGVVPIEDALDVAEAADLDLVMVSADSNPPVCKVLDYGKHKYELHKKRVESRKKQKVITVKEVQLRPSIGENDLAIKCRAIKRFIEEGDKVKVVLRYRGREMSRQEVGREVMKKVQSYCEEFAKEEVSPKLDGTVMMMILSSK